MVDQVPLPSGIDTAQRRFREIKSAIQTTGTRTLEAATISQGNFRVRHGGNIIIGDGGTLKIESGNLILGRGMIQGDALAEQFEAKMIRLPSQSKTVGGSWTSTVSSRVEVPEWAQRTIVIGSWHASRDLSLDDLDRSSYGQVRMIAGSQVSVVKSLTWERPSGSERYVYSASGAGFFDIPGTTSFLIAIQAVNAGTVQASCDALCIFTRNNS